MNLAAKSFRESLNFLSDIDYMISIIAYNIAPTLKKLKAATTVTLCDNHRNMSSLWEEYGQIVIKKLDVCAFELKKTDKATVILFYNEELLLKKIQEPYNANFLIDLGYNPYSSLEKNLDTLKVRYSKFVCPHELGIFLGFPLEDVKEFITNPHKECLICGYWKVYHDKENALKTFKYYDEAKAEIINLLCINVDSLKNIAS